MEQWAADKNSNISKNVIKGAQGILPCKKTGHSDVVLFKYVKSLIWRDRYLCIHAKGPRKSLIVLPLERKMRGETRGHKKGKKTHCSDYLCKSLHGLKFFIRIVK
jgi:hypothetical protein